MRGRRRDAVSQEAKGNPGKRRKVTIADRLKVLADAPAISTDPYAPPAILGLEEFSGAIKIWHEYAPVLTKRNILDRLDRHSLAMFCYYLDRFWTAVATIAQEGATQKVKTVAGGVMIRDHPAIRHRDDAAGIVFDLSAKFGFTPLDRHKLIREMVGTGVPPGGLLGDQEQHQNNTPTPGDDQDSIVGFGARNSARAPAKPN